MEQNNVTAKNWAEHLRLLGDIKGLQEQILAELKGSKVALGFQESLFTTVYLNAVKSPGHVWYRVLNGEQVPIKEQAFAGYLKRVDRTTETRRDKETEKLHLWMEGQSGALYRFEAGWKSHTFRSLVSSLASLTPEQLCQPIVLFPYCGDDPSVLFVKLYSGGKSVFAPYNDQTDWESLWSAVQQKFPADQPDSPQPTERTATRTLSAPQSQPPAGSGPIDQFKVLLQESNTLDDLMAIAFWLHDSAEGQEIREVPVSYGWVLDRLKEKAAAASCDMSNVLAGTDVEMRRLGWSAQDGRNHLTNAYGKRSRQELHQGQLLDFLAYLKTQPNSLLSGLAQ